MVFLLKLKHDQGRAPAHQNWGILFPLIILIGWCTFSSILFEFPTFLVYLTKISPFFEERLTKISPNYLWQLGYYLIDVIVAIPLIIFIKYILRIRYNTSFSQIGLSLFRKKNIYSMEA